MDNDVSKRVSESIYVSRKELNDLRATLVKTIKRIDTALSGLDAESTTPVDTILNGICSYYKTSREELRGRKRSPHLIKRKKMACYVLKTHTKATLEKIAFLLGYDQHRTVMYHIDDAKGLLSTELYGDKEFKSDYNKIVKHLNL